MADHRACGQDGSGHRRERNHDRALADAWQRVDGVRAHADPGDWYPAEDIVQETLLRAWRYPEIIGTGYDSPRPWLLTVTRHIAIDMWRSRSRAEAAEVIAGERYADLPDHREFVERCITALDVQAALARLSPGHRQVIIEIYYRDRSVCETAEILGIPPGTVKSRRHYSLGRRRRAMHDECLMCR